MELPARLMSRDEMESAVDRVAKRMCELAGIDPMERVTMRVDDTLLVTHTTSLIPLPGGAFHPNISVNGMPWPSLQVHVPDRGTMADFAYKGFRRQAQMQLLGWMAVAQVMAEGGVT